MLSCTYGQIQYKWLLKRAIKLLHPIITFGILIVVMVDGGKKVFVCLLLFVLESHFQPHFSGNDTSYDEQVPPDVPPAVAAALAKAGVEGNYATQNWGGGGGDWCR
jgi:hypothetical protein